MSAPFGQWGGCGPATESSRAILGADLPRRTGLLAGLARADAAAGGAARRAVDRAMLAGGAAVLILGRARRLAAGLKVPGHRAVNRACLALWTAGAEALRVRVLAAQRGPAGQVDAGNIGRTVGVRRAERHALLVRGAPGDPGADRPLRTIRLGLAAGGHTQPIGACLAR